VISGDGRFARIIAFQSRASNIVRGDRNGLTDVFAVRRAGRIGNNGGRWRVDRTRLLSRGRGGRPANGASYAPAVGGAFDRRPRCVAFLSRASNLVRRDHNGVADAFVSRGPGRAPRLVSILPGNRRTKAPTMRVAVSGDCSRIAFVAGGRLYVRIRGRRTKAVRAPGRENDPSFSTGRRNDLVFAARRGVYLARGGTGRPRLVARRGANPAYNDIKRRTVAYEIHRGGHVQIGYRDLGHRQRIVSDRGSRLGNGDSRKPVIGNSGFYVAFETRASNLEVNPNRDVADGNGRLDVYLYTDARKMTLLESVRVGTGVPQPGGGTNPSMSFYANYVLFDAPHRLRRGTGSRQVFMRWLGRK